MIRLAPGRIARRFGRDTRGATIVEFALISPVMCLLLLGLIDLGYRTYVTSVVQGAIQEAARTATVGGIAATAPS